MMMHAHFPVGTALSRNKQTIGEEKGMSKNLLLTMREYQQRVGGIPLLLQARFSNPGAPFPQQAEILSDEAQKSIMFKLNEALGKVLKPGEQIGVYKYDPEMDLAQDGYVIEFLWSEMHLQQISVGGPTQTGSVAQLRGEDADREFLDSAFWYNLAQAFTPQAVANLLEEYQPVGKWFPQGTPFPQTGYITNFLDSASVLFAQETNLQGWTFTFGMLQWLNHS
jgi:hypothetical protein